MNFSRIDPIPASPPFERVVDGFFYDFRLRPYCLAYLPLALGHEMVEVRAAFGDRRPRYVIFPANPDVTVAVTGFYEEQVPVLPGTIIWGIGIAVDSAAEVTAELLNYSLRITDLQTGYELWSEFFGINALSMVAGDGNPFILPEPHIVLAPGALLMELGARQATAASTAINFSVILFCSEPAQTCDPGDGVKGKV
jgi:hypothetical protein